VNCAAVRDQLVDHSLGTLSNDDARALDRHLVWCAACRKEAGELAEAAATFAFALAPAEPSPELEDRTVAVIDRAARRRTPRAQRRGRLAAAAAVAALLAVAALGWGSAMAGKAARAELRVEQVQAGQIGIARRFSQVLDQEGLSDPENRVFIGSLVSPDGSAAGGAALTMVSPSGPDLVAVWVSGLEPGPAQPAPYQVYLVGEPNRRLFIGKIRADAIGAAGAANLLKQKGFDVSRYTGVEILDADGSTILTGTVSLRTTIPSPSP
jgi:Putative zinc-finger